MLIKKKKRAKKARRRFDKEKEISQWVRRDESQSDMEADLESEESTEMGGDASASEDERDRGTVVTLAEHHGPVTTPIGGGRDMEVRSDVPESRKLTTSEDTALNERQSGLSHHALRRCR